MYVIHIQTSKGEHRIGRRFLTDSMEARGETATGGLDLHGRIDRLLDFRPPATRRVGMGGELAQPSLFPHMRS